MDDDYDEDQNEGPGPLTQMGFIDYVLLVILNLFTIALLQKQEGHDDMNNYENRLRLANRRIVRFSSWGAFLVKALLVGGSLALK